MIQVQIGGITYKVSFNVFHDLAIPLDFRGHQPNAFSLPRAGAKTVKTGSFAGDTRRGGSCNCEEITLIPHGNGTHTECIGHLTRERIGIHSIMRTFFLPATLVTVKPENQIIKKTQMKNALLNSNLDFLKALVVRTKPNGLKKKCRSYSGKNPPYFAQDAIVYLKQIGVEHLLTDLPSLDREDDKELKAHRAFWDFPLSAKKLPEKFSHGTITEMIYVGNEIPDGIYFLNLQITAFILDAAPSRPVLYPLKRK